MNNTQLTVVIAFIKLNVAGNVNKSQFAKENGISTRTLGRWVEKFEVEAKEQIAKEVAAANTVKKAVTAKSTTSKRAQASAVYSELAETVSRKVLIAEMVGQVGLTVAGASTYISNFKTGKWAV